MLPVLNLVCYISLCEGLRAGAGSLSYIVHVDCCGLSTIVIKKIIIIIIIKIQVLLWRPLATGRESCQRALLLLLNDDILLNAVTIDFYK